jgi:hypothetical protein
MDYMLELATALIRHVRDDKSHATETAGDRKDLATTRVLWRAAFRRTSDASESPAMAKAVLDVLSDVDEPLAIEPTPPADQDEELWLRAPDVLAVEVLADVLSKHPHLIPGALADAGLKTYPVFLEYLVLTVAEMATPPRRLLPSWKWLLANEHVNLHEDRHEMVARRLHSTDSFQETINEQGADPSAPPPVATANDGVSASMLGTGEIPERARQFREQCADATNYVLEKVGWQSEKWEEVGRVMKRPEQRERFLARLRKELLRAPSLVRELTEITAAAVPFTMAFASELEEVVASRVARGAPQHGNATHALRKASGMNLVAVALSGGGVRSATFNLGVLQALAHLGLLSRVDYLSTVSGGGYIGAWLTSWSKRLRDHGDRGVVAVERRLRDEPVTEPDAPRMRALRFLREYSNYLTPQAGFFSADTWTMIAIWLRNTLLNQTVLVLTLCAILALPWTLWFLQFKLAETTLLAPQLQFTADCTGGLFTRAPVVMMSIAMLLLYPAAVAGFQLRRFWLPPLERHRLAADMLGQQGVLFEIVTPVIVAAALLSAVLFDAIGCASSPEFQQAARRQLTGIFTAVTVVVAIGGYYAKCFFADRISTTLGPVKWWLLAAWAVLVIGVAALTSSVGGAMALLAAQDAAREAAAAGRLTLASLSFAFVAFGTPAVVSIFALMIVVKIGILGRNLFDEHREWWSRLGAWLTIASLAWLFVCAVSFYSPQLASDLRQRANTLTISLGAVLWAAWTAAGVLLAKGPETDGQTQVTSGRRLQEWIIALAPYVFVVGLLMLIAVLTFEAVTDATAFGFGPANVHERHWWLGQHWHWLLALPFVLLAVAFVLSWRVDVNEFSMHHFYKNRLVRCYLGASRDERISASERTPDPFTGFDSGDDLKVAYLRFTPGADAETRTAKRLENPQDVWRYLGPLPIINTALNLVQGDDLAWQERKAQSFAFTPFYSGYDYRHRGAIETRHAPFGFRPTSLYGYPPFGIGLGTAVAISGAAANPNMGHQSSPPAAFLMTMFNARLGWWMGNPRDKHNWLRSSPRRGLLYLLNELFSLTNDRTHFVNLSDGGHFENLGIYELIRRRCRYIIACDAEQDRSLTFSGLGNAIRKCRIDFGAEISVRSTRIRPPDRSAHSALHCVVGDITYANGDPGTLLYLKASVTGDEPADILEYKSREPAFPHHSTLGDQFFDESQFESYRKLGFHVAHTALSQPMASTQASHHNSGVPDFAPLFANLRDYWHPPNTTLDTLRRSHSEKYDELLAQIMRDPDFRFIDGAFFKEPAGTFPERRQIFVGALMLDLMQRVALDLDLDNDRDHPHNQGWVTIFRRWKTQPAVDTAWRATSESYNKRFKWFYERL